MSFKRSEARCDAQHGAGPRNLERDRTKSGGATIRVLAHVPDRSGAAHEPGIRRTHGGAVKLAMVRALLHRKRYLFNYNILLNLKIA